MRNRKVGLSSVMDSNRLHLFQPEDEEGMKYHMLKIRQTMEIAPETAYCV